MNKPVINVKNLNVDYITDKNPINAVRGVAFEIFSGEIFGLVGESGSGKSTVVQAMMRILPPPAIISKGKVLLMMKIFWLHQAQMLLECDGKRYPL